MNIVSSKEDQQGNFPSEEQLKFITDNRHQRKKNTAYADAVVKIPDILSFPVQRANYRKVNWAIKLY